MKLMATIPKKSASLLLLKPALKSKISFFNYDILVLQRSEKMAFGSALVFPGGKVEEQLDENYRKKYLLNNKLQSAALRQTFQQTGLFISNRPILQSQKLNKLSKIRIEYITNIFNNNPNAKQKSFDQISQLINPTLGMIPFIRMITIPILKHRYDTTFFVLPLQDYKNINFFKYAEHQKYMNNLQEIVHCDHEYINFRWMNPAQILSQHFNKKSFIAPPQFIMLNIMLKFQKYQQFVEFLKGKNQNQAVNTSQNYNLGPNIISLVKNQGTQSKTYPYAATLVGDKQFPYDQIIQTQSCEQLKQQVNQWKNRQRQLKSLHINRFLFKQQKNFFNTQFEIKCDLSQSVISQMKGWQDINTQIQQLIV